MLGLLPYRTVVSPRNLVLHTAFVAVIALTGPAMAQTPPIRSTTPFAAPLAAPPPAAPLAPPPPMPAVPGPGGDAFAPAAPDFADSNKASARRHAAFDKRIARRGERAIASLCNGCITGSSKPTRRAWERIDRRFGPTMPDSESIYASEYGFDPAEAWTD